MRTVEIDNWFWEWWKGGVNATRGECPQHDPGSKVELGRIKGYCQSGSGVGVPSTLCKDDNGISEYGFSPP